MKASVRTKFSATLLILWCISVLNTNARKYSTNADSTFQWFQAVKFRMFIHFYVDDKAYFNPADLKVGLCL